MCKGRVNSAVASTVGVNGFLDFQQSGDKEHVSRVEINGQEVRALRDTGSGSIIVASRLVKDSDMTGELQTMHLGDSDLRTSSRTATVNMEYEFFRGRAQVIVMENPVYNVVIGNRAVFDNGRVIKVPVLLGSPERRTRVPGVQKSQGPGIQKRSGGEPTSKKSSLLEKKK